MWRLNLAVVFLFALSGLLPWSTAVRAAKPAQEVALQDRLLAAVYVSGATIYPLVFLEHRIATYSVAGAKSFASSRDKAAWIKDFLRSQSGLAQYVGTGDPSSDVLASVAEALEHVPTNNYNNDVLSSIVYAYIVNNPGEVHAFAGNLFRQIKSNATGGASLSAFYRSTLGPSSAFPSPDASLSDLVSRHQGAFAISARSYFPHLSADQQHEAFSSVATLAAKIASDGRNHTEVSDGATDELDGTFVQAIKSARTSPSDERKQVVSDATTATQIIQALIALRDPQEAKSFGNISQNELKVFFAAEGMISAGALSMSGVGAVFAGAVGLYEALQPRSGDANTAKLLKYQAQILAELRTIKADVVSLQSMVSELYVWMDNASINDRVGFQTIEDQLYNLQDQLTLATSKLSDSIKQSMLQSVRQDYNTGQFFMTNPAQKTVALGIISDRTSPSYIQYASLLPRISEFGLEATRRTPFVDQSPWDGAGLAAIDATSWDMRVGDLPGLLQSLPAGTAERFGIDSKVLENRPNPPAWAWTVQMYIDLARWVPVDGGQDSVLGAECQEAQKTARMGTDLRKLLPTVRQLYEAAAKRMSEALDAYLLDTLKRRVDVNPRLWSGLVDLGFEPFNLKSDYLNSLINYDPDKATDTPAILIQAYARGLIDSQDAMSLENVHWTHYWAGVSGVSRLDQNGWVTLISCGNPECIYLGYTFDCIVIDYAFYLTPAGAAVMGGAPGDRIYAQKKYRKCGYQSEMANGHITDFVRKTDEELRAFMASWWTTAPLKKPENEVPRSNADSTLDGSWLPKIKAAIRSYDSSWQQDILNDFRLQSNFGANSAIAKAARAHEVARLSLRTTLGLGIAACPSTPSLLGRIGNDNDSGVAQRLPSVASVANVIELRDSFAKSAVALLDQKGQPLDIGSAIQACLPGPSGLEAVGAMLNSVSSSFPDRLPGGCPLATNGGAAIELDALPLLFEAQRRHLPMSGR